MLGRDRYTEFHYIVENVWRARQWPLWAGNLYTEVTVKAGLTVCVIMVGSPLKVSMIHLKKHVIFP